MSIEKRAWTVEVVINAYLKAVLSLHPTLLFQDMLIFISNAMFRNWIVRGDGVSEHFTLQFLRQKFRCMQDKVYS